MLVVPVSNVWIILQGIDEKKYTVIKEIHLYIDQDKPNFGSGIGKGLIEIKDRSPYDLQAEAPELLVGGTMYQVDVKKQVQPLFENIKQDQLNGVNYLITGRSYRFFSQGNSFSCLTWCLKHFKNIGLDLDIGKGWVDKFVVAFPERYVKEIKQENEDRKSTCTIM